MMMEQSKKFGFQGNGQLFLDFGKWGNCVRILIFFSGFDAAPFSPEKVLQFMEFTKEMYQKIIKDGKESKV